MSNAIIERDIDMEQLSPCSSCKYKYSDGEGCDAFPDKIPMAILLGKDKHTKPLLEQSNNIIFMRVA